MNLDEKLRRKAQQESLPVPEAFSQRVEESLQRLSPRQKKRISWRRFAGLGAAAVVALTFLLPNSSATMAQALGELPLLGPFFQVITLRSYEQQDGRNHVCISNP